MDIHKSLPAVIVRGTVPMPHNDLRIEVGRKISLKAVEQSESAFNQYLLILVQKNPLIEKPSSTDLENFGVLAKITMKIKLPNDSFNAKIFHAGTKLNNNNIYSNGGRVLCATALGKDIQQAQTKAYEFLEKVDWQGAYYRTDIGFKAI